MLANVYQRLETSDTTRHHSQRCLTSKRTHVAIIWQSFNSIPFYLIILFVIVFICLLLSSISIMLIWITFSPNADKHSSHLTDSSVHLSKEESKLLILGDLDLAKEVVIEEHTPKAALTDDSCNHYNCFDVYRCGNQNHNFEERISVYIYPLTNYVDSQRTSISSPVSQQFWQLLTAIADSEYFTPNPSNACLFIPNIDVLNQNYVRLEETSQILASLPYWKDNGSNHLIFNMISGSFPDYNTRLEVNAGRAIIAGGGFDSWTYRPTFDVAIPVYSLLSDTYKRTDLKLIDSNRKWFLTSQSDSVYEFAKIFLSDLESQHLNDTLILTSQCYFDNQSNESKQMLCNKYRNIYLKYPQILSDSTFCLIIRTSFLGNPFLSDSLMLGCIPVIISDNFILPFEEKIDWRQISIRIREHSIHKVYNILKSYSINKITQMRKRCVHVWKTYFSSMKAIGLTTLEIINDRLFANSGQFFEAINGPQTMLYKKYALINPKLSSRQSIGFTAIILTFDRLETLFEVIRCVVRASSCVKVIIIWNNQLKKPPSKNKWPNIHVPLEVIVTNENKLSNRFFPYEEIETDAILAIDDDIVMLTPDELEFGFQVWKEFPDRIVGFPSRVHRWDNTSSKWKYESEWTNDISMVLTGAAFYHKYYNHLYTNIMPKEIRSWVDQQMNCEDIAMNFLVSNATGKSPIKVTPRKKFKCPECTNVEMLSADVIQHLNERSDCINLFAYIYKAMPLQAVEFRADPVLYKDNLPERLKKFNSIGSL